MTHTTNDAPVTVEEALRWYAENTVGCRKIGRDGDIFRQALDADGGKRALAALASAPAGDGYGKWHPMLLDIVNAIHGDRGEKTQAIGIDLSYQQALAAALARPRAAVGEQSREWWTLEWIGAPRPPVHPNPMKGKQSFDTADKALAFWRKQPADATYVSLTKHTETIALQLPPAKVE